MDYADPSVRPWMVQPAPLCTIYHNLNVQITLEVKVAGGGASVRVCLEFKSRLLDLFFLLLIEIEKSGCNCDSQPVIHSESAASSV